MLETQGQAGEDPFEWGWGLSRAPLLGREGELARAERVAQAGGVLFVLGPAGHGKTALLQALVGRLDRAWGAQERRDPLAGEPTPGALPVWLEGRGVFDAPGLAARLVWNAVGGLGVPGEEVSVQLRRHFSGLRPSLREDAPAGSGALVLAPERGVEAGEALGLALDGALAMAQAASRRLVVVVDGLDRLLAEGGAALGAALAARLKEPGDGAYVLAGRRSRAVRGFLGKRGAAAEPGARLSLGPVNEVVLGRFVESAFRSAGFQVEPGSVSWLLDVAESVPAAVQRLAGACWEAVRGGSGRLTRDVVDATARAAALTDDAVHAAWWSLLTASQRRTLAAVVGQRGEDLFASATSARYGVPTPTIQSSLRTLEDRGLVWSDPDGRWRLADPLFGQWLRVVGAA